MATKEAEEIFLKNPDKWDAWNKQFQSRAVAALLWDLIDPTNEDDEDLFEHKAVQPNVKDYEKRRIVGGMNTRSQHSDATMQSEESDPNGQPTSVADMTAAGRAAFNADWNIFVFQTKTYTDQQKAIKELKDWMMKTVAQHYQHTALIPTESIKEWYKNLVQQAGATDMKQRQTAREIYKAAVKPLNKSPKDILKWLETWEEAISNAHQKGVPETMHSVEWVTDFLNVMRPYMEQWVVTYKLIKKRDIEDGTLSYRELANDFREEVRSARQKQGSYPTIAKGAFGPSFADQDDQRAAVDALEQGDAETQAGGKGGFGKTGKAKRGHNDGSQPVCLACGQFHSVKDCYYVFRNAAPKWFRFKKETEDLVANRMEDEQLKKEIEAVTRKKAKRGTSEKTNDNED